MSVTLYQGDCLEILPTLEAGSVDAVITDPPYLTDDSQVPIRGKENAVIRHTTDSVGLPWGYSLRWIDEVARLEPKHWIVFCNYRMLGDLICGLEQYAKLGCVFTWLQRNRPPMARNVPRLDCEYVVWAKHPRAKNGRIREFKSMVIDVPMLQCGMIASERVVIPGTGKAAHPTQKPLRVIMPFLQRLTEEGDTVLDCFAGTGTTGVAAIKEGRSFVGIERDPGYFDIAKRRIEEAQMQMPLLEVA